MLGLVVLNGNLARAIRRLGIVVTKACAVSAGQAKTDRESEGINKEGRRSRQARVERSRSLGRRDGGAEEKRGAALDAQFECGGQGRAPAHTAAGFGDTRVPGRLADARGEEGVKERDWRAPRDLD